MDRLIQDVLVYSRTARNDMPLERVELGSFIAGILESYPEFSSNQAAIQLQLPLAAVTANPAALTQCVSNLIGNALKFVEPGQKAHLSIWTQSTADQAVDVYFRDQGPGIEPSSLEKIFQIFYQDKPGNGGTGIGLAVVQKAAERMGGSIRVESTLGQGSTFILRLKSAWPGPGP
jgi:signal transduction histidine kinase